MGKAQIKLRIGPVIESNHSHFLLPFFLSLIMTQKSLLCSMKQKLDPTFIALKKSEKKSSKSNPQENIFLQNLFVSIWGTLKIAVFMQQKVSFFSKGDKKF